MADMSEMIKNFSAMMKGKEIPDNIKEMMNSFMNSQNNSANSTFFNVETFLIPLFFAYSRSSVKDIFKKSIQSPFLYYTINVQYSYFISLQKSN